MLTRPGRGEDMAVIRTSFSQTFRQAENRLGRQSIYEIGNICKQGAYAKDFCSYISIKEADVFTRL